MEKTWLGNPHDSGTTPINDHIKLATGPWTSSGYGALGQITEASLQTGVLLLQQICRDILFHQP